MPGDAFFLSCRRAPTAFLSPRFFLPPRSRDSPPISNSDFINSSFEFTRPFSDLINPSSGKRVESGAKIGEGMRSDGTPGDERAEVGREVDGTTDRKTADSESTQDDSAGEGPESEKSLPIGSTSK